MGFILTYILQEVNDEVLNQSSDLSLQFISMVMHEKYKFFVDKFNSLCLA